MPELPPHLQEKFGPEIEADRRRRLGDLTKLSDDELYQKWFVYQMFWKECDPELLWMEHEMRNRRVRSMCATDNSVCLSTI